MNEPGRRSTGTPAPLRVLFVCTANIARSPYAERRARQALEGLNVTVASAGIPGYPGRSMDEEMARLLQERGGDPTGHVSREVTDEVLARADLVLPFEFAQHMKLLDAHPDHAAKGIGFGHLATAARRLVDAGETLPPVGDVDELAHFVRQHAGPDSMSYDIDDPYRRGAKVATTCANQIDQRLDLVLPWLVGEELPKLAASEVDAPKRRWRWPW